MSFQTQVNVYQNPAVAGDWADKNERAMLTVGEGALLSGANGVVVGRFAWTDNSGVVSNGVVNINASTYGFVHRQQQALITTFLAESGNLIPAGMKMALVRRGGVWAQFAAGATYKQKVYINIADGTCVAAATGTPATNSFTANTTSGSATVAVTAVNGGNVLSAGQPISGAGIPAGAYIVSGPVGGGAGNYVISAAANATATGVTVTNTTTFETDFTVAQTVLAGEIAKITTWGI